MPNKRILHIYGLASNKHWIKGFDHLSSDAQVEHEYYSAFFDCKLWSDKNNDRENIKSSNSGLSLAIEKADLCVLHSISSLLIPLFFLEAKTKVLAVNPNLKVEPESLSQKIANLGESNLRKVELFWLLACAKLADECSERFSSAAKREIATQSFDKKKSIFAFCRVAQDPSFLAEVNEVIATRSISLVGDETEKHANHLSIQGFPAGHNPMLSDPEQYVKSICKGII